MKLIVNGVVFENPDRLDIRLDIDPAGEEMGPWDVLVSGGKLVVRPDGRAALTITAINGGSLYLGDRHVASSFPESLPQPDGVVVTPRSQERSGH